MRGKEDRQRAQEAKFAQDQGGAFLRQVRDVRAFGQWAAGLMGQSGEQAAATAQAYAEAYLAGGERAVREKATADLAGKVSEDEIAARIDRVGGGQA